MPTLWDLGTRVLLQDLHLLHVCLGEFGHSSDRLDVEPLVGMNFHQGIVLWGSVIYEQPVYS